jgi:transglutaminase-like putative cysteine protease
MSSKSAVSGVRPRGDAPVLKYRRYRVVHHGSYHVEGGSSIVVQLTPRALEHQQLELHQLVVRPLPLSRRVETDAHGNRRVVVEMPESSGVVDVTAVSIVRAAAAPAVEAGLDIAWETVAARGRGQVELRSFVGSSPLPEEIDAFAFEHFRPQRGIADALRALAHQMRRDFVVDPRPSASPVGLARFWHERRGTPADFCELAIGCLRSRGLAARQARGYLAPRLPSAPSRAPHAWVSVRIGAVWLDVDPVHGRIGAFDHLVLGYGRDDGDVQPVRVTTRGGACQMRETDVMVALVGAAAGSDSGRRVSSGRSG